MNKKKQMNFNIVAYKRRGTIMREAVHFMTDSKGNEVHSRYKENLDF